MAPGEGFIRNYPDLFLICDKYRIPGLPGIRDRWCAENVVSYRISHRRGLWACHRWRPVPHTIGWTRGMSDVDRAAALDDFIADLNAAWKLAGPPSYTHLRTLSKKVRESAQALGLRVMELPESTTQEILSGQRRGVPKWQWVASFHTVLRVAVADAGLNPDSLGALED